MRNLHLSTLWHIFFSGVIYRTRNIVTIIRCRNVWTLNLIDLVYKRDGKWTYNVTSRRVRVAIFVMERQQRVSRPANLIFLAESNIIYCGLSGSKIYFFQVVTNGRILGENLWKIKFKIFVLIISTIFFLWNISCYINNSAKFYHKCA